MLDSRTYAGLGLVADLLAIGQRLAPVGPLVDLADVRAVFERLEVAQLVITQSIK